MELVINGQTRHFDALQKQTINTLMDALNIEEVRGVAVAVNDEVIPRVRWGDQDLSNGDRVEIIRATQGG